MKTMKLLPLKIAVTSAMIIGLGTASTANAQIQNKDITLEELPDLIDKIDKYELETYLEDITALEQFLLLSQYGNTLTLEEFDNDIELLDQDVEDLEESVTELAKTKIA